jgi:hypothetical protein
MWGRALYDLDGYGRGNPTTRAAGRIYSEGKETGCVIFT